MNDKSLGDISLKFSGAGFNSKIIGNHVTYKIY